MPSLVQIFVVEGERKRRRVEGADAVAYYLSAGGAVSTTAGPSTSARKNAEHDQESGGGGSAVAQVFFQENHAFFIPRRPDDPPSSTTCPSFSLVHATSTPFGTSTSSSTPTSSSNTSTPAGGRENKTLVLEDHMLVVRRQQEEQRKVQEDFDSLFDNQYVFGIPRNVSTNKSNLASSNATTSVVSSADCNAALVKRQNNDVLVATRTYRVGTLVEDSDHKEATEFSFAVLEQLEPCTFDENDKRGKRTKIPTIGFPGMACRHCKGASSAVKPKALHGRTGRYFPTTLKTLSDSKKSLDAMYTHMLKCKQCPRAVKEGLAKLKLTHAEERKLKSHGSQKRFFSNIWIGLHGSADDSENTQKDVQVSV